MLPNLSKFSTTSLFWTAFALGLLEIGLGALEANALVGGPYGQIAVWVTQIVLALIAWPLILEVIRRFRT
jgi:hypothetical protein